MPIFGGSSRLIIFLYVQPTSVGLCILSYIWLCLLRFIKCVHMNTIICGLISLNGIVQKSTEIVKHGYSTLSNKRAGWNKMCRLENSAKIGNFKNLKLNWMGLKYF